MELIKERGGNWRGAVSRANQPQGRREIGYSKSKMFFGRTFIENGFTCKTKLITNFRCKICLGEVLFSYDSIRNHLWNHHSLSLTDYKKCFQAFTGLIAPSGFRNFKKRKQYFYQLYKSVLVAKLPLQNITVSTLLGVLD